MLHLAERARQGEVCKGQMTSMSADIPKWDRNLKWEKKKKTKNSYLSEGDQDSNLKNNYSHEVLNYKRKSITLV